MTADVMLVLSLASNHAPQPATCSQGLYCLQKQQHRSIMNKSTMWCHSANQICACETWIVVQDFRWDRFVVTGSILLIKFILTWLILLPCSSALLCVLVVLEQQISDRLKSWHHYRPTETFILKFSCGTRTFSSSSVCRLCTHDDRGWNPEEKGFPAAVQSSTGEILFRRFLGMSSLKGLLWKMKFMLTWVNVKYQSQEQLENRPQNDLLGAEKLINNVRKSFRLPVW